MLYRKNWANVTWVLLVCAMRWWFPLCSTRMTLWPFLKATNWTTCRLQRRKWRSWGRRAESTSISPNFLRVKRWESVSIILVKLQRKVKSLIQRVCFCFAFLCSWWTYSSATAISDATFYCSTSSSSSTSRVRSSSKGLYIKWTKPLRCLWCICDTLFSPDSSSCILNDDQATWIEETTKLAYQVSPQ